MAIGTPTQRYTSASAPGATLVFSPATTVAAGSVAIIAMGGGFETKYPTGVIDSVGNTWSVDAVRTTSSPSTCNAICSCQVLTPITSSDTITITFLSPTSSPWVVAQLLEVTGLATSSVFDKTAGNQATSGTAADTGLTATLSQADELVVAVIVVPGAVGWTADGSYTKIASADDNSGSLEWKVVAATTAVNATGTLGSSSSWGMLLATYKGLVSVAAPPVLPPAMSGIGF